MLTSPVHCSVDRLDCCFRRQKTLLYYKIQTYLHYVVPTTKYWNAMANPFVFCPCFFFWGLCTVSYPQSRIMYVREFNPCPGLGHKWLINSFRKKNLETTHKKIFKIRICMLKCNPLGCLVELMFMHWLPRTYLAPEIFFCI
jgi:hypothetical protein